MGRRQYDPDNSAGPGGEREIGGVGGVTRPRPTYLTYSPFEFTTGKRVSLDGLIACRRFDCL